MKTFDCIKWLWDASRGVRARVAVASFVGVLHVAFSMCFVWVCKSLIDLVTSSSDESAVTNIVLLVVCLIMQVLLSAQETRLMSFADISFKNRLRHKLFSILMGSRWDGKESFHSGDSLNRVMEDVRVIADAITRSIPALVTSGVQFLAAFTFLFFLKPKLAWTIPVIMLVMLILSRSYISRMRKLTKSIRSTESQMQSMMQESLQHRVVIHTLERTSDTTDFLAGKQLLLKNRVMDKADYSIFARSMIQLGFSAGYAVAFLWGVLGIKAGTATFGMMTAFLQLVGQIQRPIMNLSRQLPALINSLTSAERLSELSSTPLEKTGEPIPLEGQLGIRFNNVSYSYPDSQTPVLKDFSHDFKPGTTTALLGETGVGKSTMMRLVLGLLTPDEGDVEIYDSQRSVECSPLTRCNIIYVPQGNTLMSGTIRENICLGEPDATDEEIFDVLHLAAADFVNELPEGLDTLCGEKGAGLSEGQAQRIAIARSLLRKGGILLMDEPTASLDSATEETLLKRLSERLDGRTLILVTHRAAAATLCQYTLHL